MAPVPPPQTRRRGDQRPRGATHDVTRRADLLQRRAIVAGGAITEFGHAVTEFNQLIDQWNAQIQCAADYQAAMAIYQEHLPAYRRADILHEAEHAAMSRLTNWDDDATIKDLWHTGALPINVAPLFPSLNLKLDDLESVDTLDMLVKLGHTLLLTNIRGPITAAAGLGQWASWSAGRLSTSPATQAEWAKNSRLFGKVRETVNGTNWGRWGKVGGAASKILPWTSLTLDTTKTVNDYRNGDYGWAAYHFIEAIADGLSFSAAAPVAAPISALMGTGEVVYDNRNDIATAAEFAWNNPDTVSKFDPTVGGGIYAAKGTGQAAEWMWDKATGLWPF